jgi:hypothetical protein
MKVPPSIFPGRDPKSNAVKRLRQVDVFHMAIAPRSALDRPFHTVDPFGYRIADPMRAVGHKVIASLHQIPCWFLHLYYLDTSE